jgi:hypothetical protein
MFLTFSIIIGAVVNMTDQKEPDKEIKKPEPAKDDEIIELSDDTDDKVSDFEGDTLEPIYILDDELDTQIALDESMEDDLIGTLGMELDLESETDEKEESPEAIDISDEQVEAALERVIRKIFYEKIDHILTDVIDKTVSREIETLKGTMLGDAGDNEK